MSSVETKALQLFEAYQAKNSNGINPNTLIEAVSSLIGLKADMFNTPNDSLVESEDELSPEDQKRLDNVMRGWNGKLKRIDNLLSWMYDKGVLNKGEKAEKDRLFRQYYRWYNDGDLPAILRKRGFSKHQMRFHGNDNLLGGEAELEKLLDGFISKILTKYLPKINRRDFRIDRTLKDLEVVHKSAQRCDVAALFFWAGQAKADVKSEELDELKTVYDKFQKDFKAAPEKPGIESYDSLRHGIFNHLVDSVNLMSKEQLKVFKSYEPKIKDLCKRYEDIIKATMDGLEKLKSELKK